MEQSKSAHAGKGIKGESKMFAVKLVIEPRRGNIGGLPLKFTSNGLWAEIVTNYLPGFSECSLAVRRGQDSRRTE